MTSADHQQAQGLALTISNGINLLYQIWRKQLDESSKAQALDGLEILQSSIVSLRELGTQGGVHHDFSEQQLETDDLQTLHDMLASWDPSAELPDAASEVAGDCVERLTQQRPSQLESLQRGNQATVPLSSAVTKGIACLSSLREQSSLFSQRESRGAVDDLWRVLAEMPEKVQRDLGLTVDQAVLKKLKDLRQVLVDEMDTAQTRQLATESLETLLGAKAYG